jgi:hypothetical protein
MTAWFGFGGELYISMPPKSTSLPEKIAIVGW